MIHSDEFEEYPTLSNNRIMEFLLTKYPDKPWIARMFQSAIEMKLTDGRIAWQDLGVFDEKRQQELEIEVNNLINMMAEKRIS